MHIELLDTTLREGEQTPGVALSLEAKLEIAHALDAFGCDVIEIGHPAASERIASHAAELASRNLDAATLAHARALPGDIEAAAASGADWVGIFFSVSDAALEQRFRRDQEQATALIVEAIELARDHGLQVRYTPEDTVRTPLPTLLAVSQAACQAGAHRISVADTAGCMTPFTMAQLVTELTEALPVPIHVHCHNDLGMAVANSLAAVQAGAQVVDVTINGLGERCGITPLAPLTLAADRLLGTEHNWQLDQLPALSELVARHTGIPIHPLEPIVGANAFAHNAGLHVAAVLQDPSHYEFIPAHLVGRERRIVLDQLSGRAACEHRLEQIGLDPSPALVDQVLHVVKALGSQELDDEQLTQLVRTIELAREAPGREEDPAEVIA